MGNEQGGGMADPNKPPPPDFKDFFKDFGKKNSRGGIDRSGSGNVNDLDAEMRLQVGDVRKGDVFITWHSSARANVSYKAGSVVDIFFLDSGSPLYGETRKKRQTKYVVLEYDNGRKAELDIPGLKASVLQAKQALKVEEEWMAKVGSSVLLNAAIDTQSHDDAMPPEGSPN